MRPEMRKHFPGNQAGAGGGGGGERGWEGQLSGKEKLEQGSQNILRPVKEVGER